MTDAIMICEIIKVGTDQIIVTEQISIDKIEIDQGMKKNYRRGNCRGNVRTYQNLGRQSSRGEYRGNYRNEDYSIERGRRRSREISFSRNNNNNRRNDGKYK